MKTCEATNCTNEFDAVPSSKKFCSRQCGKRQEQSIRRRNQAVSRVAQTRKSKLAELAAYIEEQGIEDARVINHPAHGHSIWVAGYRLASRIDVDAYLAEQGVLAA